MIYSNREYQNLATKERVLFTDSYAVRFWWLEPGTEFARPHEVIYHTNGQDQHEQIQARWQQDYPTGRLVRISYQ